VSRWLDPVHRVPLFPTTACCASTAVGHDPSKRLSALTGALRGIPAHSAVVDAELCFPGPDGAPDFLQLLKAAFGNQGQTPSKPGGHIKLRERAT